MKHREMLSEGTKVKIRWRRSFQTQPTRVFLGVVNGFSGKWIKVYGRTYLLRHGASAPLVDRDPKHVMAPNDSIELIRVLPEDLDLDNVSYDFIDGVMVIRPGAGLATRLKG